MKRALFVFVCLFVIIAGTSCTRLINYFQSKISEANEAAGGFDDTEETAEQIEADITYTNSYLGFSYTIPKDWWLYSINESNFAADPSRTENPETMDISYGQDAGMDYSFISFANFGSLRDSRRDNHIGIDISAETLDGINSLAEYMVYYESYMLEPDENTYKLLDTARVEINGVQYEKRNFEVIRKEANFIYATYTRPAGDNYYLTIKASYWPDNRNAETFIANGLSKAMP